MQNVLNSTISKLLQRPEKKEQLIFNNDSSNKKYKELKAIATNLNLDEHSFLVVSTFLQNTDLSVFTKEEVELLLSFDYSSITANRVLPNTFSNKRNKPLFDLGGKIINLDMSLLNNINKDFLKVHSMHKSLSIEYLVSYIINQL